MANAPGADSFFGAIPVWRPLFAAVVSTHIRFFPPIFFLPDSKAAPPSGGKETRVAAVKCSDDRGRWIYVELLAFNDSAKRRACVACGRELDRGGVRVATY